jgi:beta-lactamase class A
LNRIAQHVCSVALTALLFASTSAVAKPTPGAAGPAATTATGLQATLDDLAQRAAPAILGIAVLDPRSGGSWGVNAARPFPMMSVFKAPVAAAILARIDAGTLTLDQRVTIERADVLDGSAVPSIGEHFVGERMTFTVERLLVAAVSESDNTAADALVRLAGGPDAVTAFLRAHGVEGMRVDMDEAGVQRVFDDLHAGQSIPAKESTQEEHDRRQRGYNAFLADPRNRSTPDAAVVFLHKLWTGKLLTRASTLRLQELMQAQTVPDRMRAGLPASLRFADKTGTSGVRDGAVAAFNDIGAITWPEGHTVFVAAFLSESHASPDERDALFAKLARAVAATFAQ